MKLLANNQEALKHACPYCHAKPNERCKTVQGSIHTLNSEPRDWWGRPLIHNARVGGKK